MNWVPEMIDRCPCVRSEAQVYLNLHTRNMPTPHLSHKVSPSIHRCTVACATVTLLTAAAPAASAGTHRLNAGEMALFKKITHDSGQHRSVMKLDPILCKVARKRAEDMARNSYFGHIDLTGRGPNRLVKLAGFVLPSWYDQSRGGNNIESIVLTAGDTTEALDLWKNSPPHRVHLLGELSFYRDQKSVGIGTFTTSDTPSQTYYVFLSAPENQSVSPPRITLKNTAGRLISSTR